MKRILVTGAGGAAATNFVRSLRMSPEPCFLVGTDCNKYYLHRAETDRKYLVPRASDPDYIDVLNEIIGEENLEFLHAQNDREIAVLSEARDRVKARMFLPPDDVVRCCQDKFTTFRSWRAAGLRVPETVLLNKPKDLADALARFGNRGWLRATAGAGGRGSLLVEDFAIGKAWVDFHRGWGSFTVAEYLSPDSVTWSSIWYKGELVVAQSRKRLYWELSHVSPTGVTGATGGAVTVSDPAVDQVAMNAVLAITSRPHGIFSVDLTYDRNGWPNPTEINIGRFFTTHFFFAKAGLNMPEIVLRLAYGEPLPPLAGKINPLPANLVWIRGVDFEPVLTTLEAVEETAATLAEFRRRVRSTP